MVFVPQHPEPPAIQQNCEFQVQLNSFTQTYQCMTRAQYEEFQQGKPSDLTVIGSIILFFIVFIAFIKFMTS